MTHGLSRLVFVSLCSSVVLCGNREHTGFLCGAEQRVGTSSDPSGHSAADSVSLNRFLTQRFSSCCLKIKRLRTEHAMCFQVSGVTLKVNGSAAQSSPHRHTEK